MRSNAEFDRFISGELKRAADSVEAPSRCKAEIDERIASAESGRQKGGTLLMRNWTVRKFVTAAAVCCLLIGTGVFAARKLTSIVSHGGSEPSITEYEKVSELEAEAGFKMRTEEDFTNGFVFTGGGITNTEGQDEQGSMLSNWKMISLTYKDKGGRTLTIDAEPESAIEQDLSADATEKRTIQGTEVYYNYTEMYLVPPTYKPTAEEEERNQNDPHFNIAYGSDAPETRFISSLAFAKDGVRYYITTFDEVSAEELFGMAEELLD